MGSNPPFALQSLLEKMSSPDSDYRFMSLNDLLSILTSPNGSLAQTDTALAGRVIDGVVKALDDANGEVQNLAVKWYVSCRSLFLALPIRLLFLYIWSEFVQVFYSFHGTNPDNFSLVLGLWCSKLEMSRLPR